MSNNEPNDHNVQERGINALLDEIAECQRQNNVPVYVGEFNIFDFYDLWSILLRALKRKNVLVCIFKKNRLKI